MDFSKINDSDLERLALTKIAERCKTDLYFFCKEILGYNLMTPHTHQELCDYTTSLLPNPPEVPKDDNFDARKNMLLLLMPRGTFKSSVVTIGFSLQYILNEPDARILIDSETFSKSKAFLREIIGHIEGNDKFRAVFECIYGMKPYEKRSKAKLWTDSELILPCRKRDRKEPTYSCAGIDVTKNGMHYDLIIMDDLHSENNVTNKDQIDKVINHYKFALSLLDPGKELIVIGTRWDYSDLYQFLIDFQASRFNILHKSAYNKDGTLFFPERLTEQFLTDQKESQGSYVFSCQYLNEPVSDENATFKRDTIIRKPLAEIEGRPINWYLSVDPSYEGAYSDYAAFVLAGMDFQRDIYVRWVVRKKMTYGEIINQIFEIYTNPRFKEIKINKIIVETIATQKSLGIELANEQRRRNTWLPIQEIRSRTESKEERIRGLAPFYEFGHIYHITECPQLEDLEYELLHFPRGSHDDVIDALATVLEVASPPNKKSSDYSDDNRRSKRVIYKPRSAITGV